MRRAGGGDGCVCPTGPNGGGFACGGPGTVGNVPGGPCNADSDCKRGWACFTIQGCNNVGRTCARLDCATPYQKRGDGGGMVAVRGVGWY